MYIAVVIPDDQTATSQLTTQTYLKRVAHSFFPPILDNSGAEDCNCEGVNDTWT